MLSAYILAFLICLGVYKVDRSMKKKNMKNKASQCNLVTFILHTTPPNSPLSPMSIDKDTPLKVYQGPSPMSVVNSPLLLDFDETYLDITNKDNSNYE